MAGTYQQVRFSELVSSLAIRLSDPGKVFWSDAELQSYLIESLRTWQAYSATISTRGSFQTRPNVSVYDIFTEIPTLAPSVTDRQLIADIQHSLMEPVGWDVWRGTEQFTLEGVIQAIQRRRDRLLLESGVVLTASEVNSPSPGNGNLPLDGSVIDVRRAMWKDQDGRYTLLWKADQFTMTAAAPGWMQSPGVPSDFSTILQHPLVMQLSPPPADVGAVSLVTVNSLGSLTPATVATVLGIPDDLCWVVKFGALADLYVTDGPGEDKARARYCENRWKDGVQLARIYNLVRLGYQSGVPSFVDSLGEIDQARPSWVNELPGPPEAIGILGNLVAVLPTPDNTPHSVSFDLTPKFPIPQMGSSWIQVGQEILDVIIDYAQHLAQIKVGASDLNDTMGLYENLVKVAAVTNDRLRAQANNFDVLSDRSLRGEKTHPRRKSDTTLKELDYAQS